jgi:hypothetical protein
MSLHFPRALVLAALLGLAIPANARAEQRELAIGVQPAYGLTYIDERSPSGGGGIAHLSYGITDAVGIQLQGGATVHPLSALMDDMHMLPAGLLTTWQASAGVVYALDIVRVVPFFEASVGILGTLMQTDAGIQRTLDAGISLGLGADYLITRRWAVGVAIRYHAFLTDPSKIPIYLTVGPRVLIRFAL